MGAASKSVKLEAIDPTEQQIKAEGDNGTDKEDPNATDYSSSFDDTLSGTDTCSMSENEVESSHFYGVDSFPFDGFSSVFPMRKKKLTSHWRNFIRPLMWRCKWAQLKIMQLQSQASKYDREIARYNKRKHLKLDPFAFGNMDANSMPSTSKRRGEKIMKRRKRKRVEDDTADVASYLSQHNLFSYIENRKPDQDGSSLIEEFGNPVVAEQNSAGHEDFGIHDDFSFHDTKLNDDCIGDILKNIDVVHSRVQELKSRLIVVLDKNCMSFSSSSEDLSLLMPCDGQTSCPQSLTLSACDGDTSSLGALFNEIGDFVIPESIVASYGEPFYVPDIIESTVGLVPSLDVTMLHPQIGDSCEAIMDNAQLQEEAAETERSNSENMNKQTTQNNPELEATVKQENNEPPQSSAPENDPILETVTSCEQSKLTSCLASEINFPKSKRKRGERKAGSGGWNR